MTKEEAFFAMINKGFSPNDSDFWKNFASEFKECKICDQLFEHDEFLDIPVCKGCYLDRVFPFQIKVENHNKQLKMYYFLEKGIHMSKEDASFINQLPQMEAVAVVVDMKTTAGRLFMTDIPNTMVCNECQSVQSIKDMLLLSYEGRMISLCSKKCKTLWEENKQ